MDDVTSTAAPEPSPMASRAPRLPVQRSVGHLDDAPPDDLTAVPRALLAAAAASPRPILVVDGRGARQVGEAVVLWSNRATAELLGLTDAELTGRPLSLLLAPLGPDEGYPHLLRPERSARAVVEVVGGGGSRMSVTMLTLPDAASGTWTVHLAEAGTAAERAARAEASAQEQRFAALVEHSPVPTMISDVGMRLAHVNDAFCSLLGEQQEALLGTGWMSHVVDDDVPLVVSCVEGALAGDRRGAEVRLLRTDGQTRWVRLQLVPTATPGRGAGFVGTAEDFTERRAFEQRLAHQTRHDALTGLPNRTALTELMAARLAPAGPGGGRRHTDISPMTCIFLDLDNFKTVNDSLGHDTGDRLLVAVAQRLRRSVRADDVVARWGGDEFVVVCAGVPDDAGALALGQDVLDRLRQGVDLDGTSFTVVASVGVTRVTSRHLAPEDVLQDCDIAMYRAKHAGRDRVALCDADARRQAREQMLLSVELREALAAGQLTVEYQPILDLHDPGALPAVEALVRWYHPERGPVRPDLLVQVAEANGLIEALGMFVLRTSCDQVLRWDAEMGPAAPRVVHVNLSVIQLSARDVVDRVGGVLAETGMDASRLCLEVTETALLQDPAATRARLLQLRAMGVQVALDDFGTGYSSLAYLRQLPVDHLKVDRAFVTELHEGHPEVVSAVVGLARSLGLEVVAEGVEHVEQADALREMGAHLAQGWLYAPAMTGRALVTWARERLS